MIENAKRSRSPKKTQNNISRNDAEERKADPGSNSRILRKERYAVDYQQEHRRKTANVRRRPYESSHIKKGEDLLCGPCRPEMINFSHDMNVQNNNLCRSSSNRRVSESDPTTSFPGSQRPNRLSRRADQRRNGGSRRRADALPGELRIPKKISTCISTVPGGSVTAGTGNLRYDAVHQARRSNDLHGQAASMAALLLAAALRKAARTTLPSARILIHQPWGGVQGQATDIGIQAREIVRLKKMLIDYFAEHTGKSFEEKICHRHSNETILCRQESVEYGPCRRGAAYET